MRRVAILVSMVLSGCFSEAPMALGPDADDTLATTGADDETDATAVASESGGTEGGEDTASEGPDGEDPEGSTGEPPFTEDTGDADEPIAIEHDPPAVDDPPFATLAAGEPFVFQGRYHFASVAGATPSPAVFAHPDAMAIPALRSGHVVAIEHDGVSTLARLLGTDAEDEIVAADTEGAAAEALQFRRLPWTAFGNQTNAAAACSTGARQQFQACMQTSLGALGPCAQAQAEVLGACVSGHDPVIPPSLGVAPADPDAFACAEPAAYLQADPLAVRYTDPLGEARDCTFVGGAFEQPVAAGCASVYVGALHCGPHRLNLTDQRP